MQGLSLRRFGFAALLLSLVFSAALAVAAAAQQPWVVDADQKVKQWQEELFEWVENPPSLEKLEARQTALLDMRQRADTCVQEYTVQLEAVAEKLTALGEQREDEADDVKRLRRETTQDKETLEGQLALCKVVILAAKDLQAELKSLRNDIVKQALGQRENEVWHSISALLAERQLLRPGTEITFTWWPSSLAALGALLVLYPMATYLARMLRRLYPQPEPPASWHVSTLFFHMLARRLPWIAAISSLVLWSYLGGTFLLSAVLMALVLTLVFAPIVQMLLCQGVYRCAGGLPLRGLLYLVLSALALYLGDIQTVLNQDALLVGYALFTLLLAATSLHLLFDLARRENLRVLRALRIPLTVGLILGPVALWLGYRSLADLLMPGIYGTLGGMLLLWLLYRPFSQLFTLLDTDPAQNSEGLRGFLGYAKDEAVPGLWLGRLLVLLMFASLLVFWALFVWRVPQTEVETFGAYLTGGFQVGNINIVPAKLVLATVVFSLVLTLARWLRNQLSERWLTHTRLDAGARQSIVALTTYVIVGVAILISLSMAGLDFQNLAIVAGALSVGIGFGLQNIVNNFVSGLILLFERPVKPGDWIVVGATEGHVQKVSIRYTQIRTFDRADVLVPNSELISSQVTNWMLRDKVGRVIAPVGVAYGSDTGLVKDILLRVAREHPLVLTKDSQVPAPNVIFMGFGASSLDFELRCFIRDVDFRLAVRSDLLFAIDKAFREHAIEIPFPQRVVHMAKDEPQQPGSESPDGDQPPPAG